MLFLCSRAGHLNARSIVTMAPLLEPDGRSIWRITYELGGNAHATTAFREDVLALLERLKNERP